MAKKIVPTASDEDYSHVVAYLKQQSLFPVQPSSRCMELARSVHTLTHSLIMWRFRLKKLPEHSVCFVEEIASDALQILPQITSGFTKPVKLLSRGLIENLIRHIYFTDHPIEFAKMNNHPKWYVSVEDLFDYAREHPFLAEPEKGFDALVRLKVLYSELSAGVHGRRVQDFQMKVALSKLCYDDASASKQASVLARTTEATNFVLAAFHNDQFRSFAADDRKLILKTMPQLARKVLMNLPSS